MEDLFLHVFNIAITAGWIVLAALAVRLLLRRRLPGWVKVILWGVVGVRLLFPFSLESVLSLIPSAEAVPPTITTSPAPSVNVGVPVVDQVINPVISQTMTPVPEASVNPMQVLVFVASVAWLVGTALMLCYLFISYLRIYLRVRASAPMEKGVRYCDGIAGAFVLGVLNPRIYLSSAIPAEDVPYVLAHERAHLRRGDHVWKLLGFLLLSVYWFHPLLWVAYLLLCRDIETACDERVLKQLGPHAVKPYAMALVNCGELQSKYRVQHCPVAFGETRIKERVKNVLNYKKPKLWITVGCILLIVVVAVCFLTNPPTPKDPADDPTEHPTNEIPTDEAPTDGGTEKVDTPVTGRVEGFSYAHPNIAPKVPFLNDATIYAIGSYEQWQAFCAEYYSNGNAPQYDREYFTTHSLAVYSKMETSSSIAIKIMNVQVRDGKLVATVGRYDPEVHDNAMKHWCLFIEIEGDVVLDEYSDAVVEFVALDAYGNAISGAADLPEEMQIMLKTAYLNHSQENISAADLQLRFYGVYDGAYAFEVFNPNVEYFDTIIDTESVAGLVFRYMNGIRLFIYKDGAIYTLTEANAWSLIRIDALMRILEYHQDAYPKLYTYIEDPIEVYRREWLEDEDIV